MPITILEYVVNAVQIAKMLFNSKISKYARKTATYRFMKINKYYIKLIYEND